MRSMFRVFGNILRQTFDYAKSYKIFWLAGLFLVWFTLVRSMLIISLFLKKLPVTVNEGGVVDPITNSQNIWSGVLALILILFFVIYYFRSKAAIVLAVRGIREKKFVKKTEIYKDSRRFFKPLLNSSMVLGFFLLVMTVFVATPIAYLMSNGYTARASTLLILGILVYIPVFIVLYYSMIFSTAFMSAYEFSFKKSLFGSLALIRELWPSLVIFSIVLFGFELFGLILSVAATIISVLPFVIFLHFFYDMVGLGVVNVVHTLAASIGFVVFFLSQAFVAGFTRLAWTLLFFELIKPVKDEEKVEEVVPEVAN